LPARTRNVTQVPRGNVRLDADPDHGWFNPRRCAVNDETAEWASFPFGYALTPASTVFRGREET
jgi:hypothetical protein